MATYAICTKSSFLLHLRTFLFVTLLLTDTIFPLRMVACVALEQDDDDEATVIRG
jgi:hypothetical protein